MVAFHVQIDFGCSSFTIDEYINIITYGLSSRYSKWIADFYQRRYIFQIWSTILGVPCLDSADVVFAQTYPSTQKNSHMHIPINNRDPDSLFDSDYWFWNYHFDGRFALRFRVSIGVISIVWKCVYVFSLMTHTNKQKVKQTN